MNTFGTAVRLCIFGASHGKAVGCTTDGLPAGMRLDFDAISSELARRMSGGEFSTPRHEDDLPEIISGVYDGKTDGTPLTALFYNRRAASTEYALGVARPSHADLTAAVKYEGANDPNGGGQFSGRMTLPLVFAGAVCKQYLSEHGIFVASHIASIGTVSDSPFNPTMEAFPPLDPHFPLVNPKVKPLMEAALADANAEGDTLGGVAECAVLGVPIGVGEPFFDSVESEISHMLFSIPAVRAVEFGDGFALCNMRGSAANDAFKNDMTTVTNRSGGLNGGIANGMPLIFRVGFRPIPSISTAQSCYDMSAHRAVTHTIRGRHDTCALPRAAVAAEAAASFCLLDMLIRGARI